MGISLKNINITPYLKRVVDIEESFYEKLCSFTNKSDFDDYSKEFLKENFNSLYLSATKQNVSSELRRFKRQASLLIALADLSGIWDTNKTTIYLSVLAEACIRIAVSTLIREAQLKGKWTIKNQNNPELDSGLIVLAMGKLGGRELNYSSDVDLIVLYDDQKAPLRQDVDAGNFFVKLTRDLVSILEEKTADGYVFRTDLRLRPDPGATPVAINVNGAISYYESFALNWERTAFIKARPIAGDKTAARQFLKDILPFVWRKTTDFYALEQIYALKRQINSKVSDCDNDSLFNYNIKLGKGGIREIEFFTQLQQLLWGGRNIKLRSRKTLFALKQLRRSNWISEEQEKNLKDAYLFFRTLEHRLQMVQDEQTQTMPSNDEDFRFVANLMNMTQEELCSEIKRQRKIVSDNFESLFKDESKESNKEEIDFTGTDVAPATIDKLTKMGFKEINFIADAVHGWLCGRYRAMRSDKARDLLSDLLFPIFKSLSQTKSPDNAFNCFDTFLKGLPSGIQLFSLFQSRPMLLDVLMTIISDAPLFAKELERQPDLFGAVLQPDFFKLLPNIKELEKEARDLVCVTDNDMGTVLDILRRFNREKRFQVCVLLLQNLIDVQSASKSLSDIAFAVLKVLTPFVIKDFERINGKMPGGDFSVVVLGKTGAGEMRFSSDLDLLFLFNAEENAVCDSKKAWSANVYYARLAQKMINAISAPTAQGVLYDIDMRLRPSGSSGPVAVSIESFKKYYKDSAWTWEKMALTKASVVYGDLGKQEIIDILSAPMDEKVVLKDAEDMKNKLHENFASNKDDIKYKTGGMIDIEFFVQTYRLIHPEIKEKNVIEALDKINTDEALKMKEKYLDLKTQSLYQSLQ
ncbi:MAG: bifunctional [glutamine synthetase] adenylyltransferase/[glutamine synthetase]-adenylyl-L-tyrosine phosphorylase [Alphaproteobacteria bacterium]|nr:bifunctional [glutamine synthetase] adenylyltransferase/[glutamine synthetase]-adenylyl-L-tyrosine phosphorylase [Alphaproteobacteria bacterium]